MITIYQIGRSGIWTGATAEIEENDGAPPGWTRTAPPALGEGQYALWVGGWQVVDALPAEPAPLLPVLPPLTRRQLRLALLSIGVTAEDVEAHISDITDPVDRAAAMIEWEDATHYKRDHPLVADVAASMALPPAQVDALWVWAGGL